MRRFMKTLNSISRCQAYYRNKTVQFDGITANHHAFMLFIANHKGCSQEEIAKELCINKSTVTRSIDQLEKSGYVKRIPNINDKREYLIFPTEKFEQILPSIRNASNNWNMAISEDIPDEEIEIFYSVLSRIEEKAKKIVSEL